MLFKPRTDKSADTAILRRTTATAITARPVVKLRGGTGGIADVLTSATTLVEAQLGKFRDQYILIRDEETLRAYFAEIKKNKKFALDTETSGLNPISDFIVGVCLYTPGQKGAYIPLNHTSYITGALVKNQVTVSLIAQLLAEINTPEYFIVMHNAKFDIRFCKNQLGVNMRCDWDTMIAANILNENEPHHLKGLHSKYCNQGNDYYKFESLFKGVPFQFIPIKTAYLYAARDPIITWELYEFQKQYLNENDPDLKTCYDAFINNEMPLLPVMVDVEDTGVRLDMERQKELHNKYEKKLADVENKVAELLKFFEDKISAYRSAQLKEETSVDKDKRKLVRLDSPINLGSAKQVAVLLYDILKLSNGRDGEDARGTGEKLLLLVKEKAEKKKGNEQAVALIDAILDLRGVKKLLSTYIDKMPAEVNKVSGKIHCSFNQYGTVTGRMSSNEPNMQNIPARDEPAEIRTMFTANPGEVLVSCDYSQQEPRILAHISGDEHMITTYREGRDLYAQMAALVFHKKYEECLEHFPDGSLNKEGKKLRGRMKAIVLGVMYSKEAPSIAEDLKISREEAENLYNTFFTRFPKVKKYLDDTQNFARQNGYVKTLWGRKRHLPDMMLPEYEISYSEAKMAQDVDVMDFSGGVQEVQEVSTVERNRIIRELKSARGYVAKQFVIKRWADKGYKVVDNTRKIKDAERQCVNSVIQGTAADMTKQASVICFNDPRLKKIGAKIVLWVHDETISSVPLENAAEACKYISENMKKAAARLCVPMKCDCEVMKCWGGPVITPEEG